MIFGLFDPTEGREAGLRSLAREAARRAGRPDWEGEVWSSGEAALAWWPDDSRSGAPRQPCISDDGSLAIVFAGILHNERDFPSFAAPAGLDREEVAARLLLHLYRRDGRSFIETLNGKFVFALWDAARRELLLGRDHLGLRRIYYHRSASGVAFSSSLMHLAGSGLFPKRLDRRAVVRYLTFDYNPGEETFAEGASRLRSGHLLVASREKVAASRYWRVDFAEITDIPFERRCEEILGLIRGAVEIRLDPQQPTGVLLSGGTDSSAMVALAAQRGRGKLRTFSFRCEGRSYDESRWARLVASRFGTDHTEVSYGPEDLSLVPQAVRWMEEPFCDAGIEIATCLLGRAAQGAVSYVLSGEGGDELFAGHPSYVADGAARLADHVPHGLREHLANVLARVPDAEAKKNLQVKVKRFGYGLALPSGLLSNRWRAHYTPVELLRALTRDYEDTATTEVVFGPIFAYNREGHASDFLSRSLYGDYQTLVDFYVRRLNLLRHFGIESYTPLLDHRLVTYAAHIPSRLKLKGFSETKFIYRRALEGLVPREILHDRPKLGHSVPLKNWLREDRPLARRVQSVLARAAERDIVRPEFIGRMVREHAAMRHNHAHRIWGLYLLELWLEYVWENETATPVETDVAGARMRVG